MGVRNEKEINSRSSSRVRNCNAQVFLSSIKEKNEKEQKRRAKGKKTH
jgi:hypothetical protein